MRRERVSIKLDPLPPDARAYLEINQLSSVPELVTQCMLGGPTPPEMERENEHRHAEYQRRKLAIIEKHGVADVYLEPLLVRERQLDLELAQVREEIAELQAIQKA